jgi:hypothetical protein
MTMITRPTADEIRSRAGQLMNVFEGSVPAHVPVHIVVRLAMLVGHEEPQYVDHNLTRHEAGHFAGQVVIVTGTRVVLLTMLAPQTAESWGTVAASTWSRAALQSINITPDSHLNTNAVWDSIPDFGWPRGGGATLSYADGRELTLPLPGTTGRAQMETFADLLPGLYADLSLTA